MTVADVLVIAVIGVIVGLAALYIHREKKKGVRCIGCPDSGKCAGNCAACHGDCSGEKQ